jgi:Fic family protein
LKAAVAYYQYATIHPYDDNCRTARLLTILILHLSGYDLKGLHALEEHYARDLKEYYEVLTIGPSHKLLRGSRRGWHHQMARVLHRRHGSIFREGA